MTKEKGQRTRRTGKRVSKKDNGPSRFASVKLGAKGRERKERWAMVSLRGGGEKSGRNEEERGRESDGLTTN